MREIEHITGEGPEVRDYYSPLTPDGGFDYLNSRDVCRKPLECYRPLHPCDRPLCPAVK